MFHYIEPGSYAHPSLGGLTPPKFLYDTPSVLASWGCSWVSQSSIRQNVRVSCCVMCKLRCIFNGDVHVHALCHNNSRCVKLSTSVTSHVRHARMGNNCKKTPPPRRGVNIYLLANISTSLTIVNTPSLPLIPV